MELERRPIYIIKIGEDTEDTVIVKEDRKKQHTKMICAKIETQILSHIQKVLCNLLH
jgi:hypothetical protein